MSTLRVDTITDTTGLLAPVFPAGSAQLNPLANREDKVINGDFGIWQRGQNSALLGYVAADRWYNSFIGGTITQSLGTFAIGDTLGVNSPTYFLRQTVSGQTLATQYATTLHRIESVRSYAGQTITVLGWARRSSGTGDMCIEGLQSFGSGGGGSPETYFSPTTIPLGVTGTWAPFAAVITVPTITGKTLGANGNDAFGFQFFTSAGSTLNARSNSLGLQTIGVDLWGIHIRQGTWTAAATADYRPRDFGTERALCQRYYVRLGGEATNDILLQGAMSTTVAMSMMLPLPVSMRSTPVAAKVGTWSVSACSQPQIVSSSTTVLGINAAGTSATLIGAQTGSTTTAFLTVDAEL